MDKEKILLEALNEFGNFTSVEQKFNANQLEVIYKVMGSSIIKESVCDLCEGTGIFKPFIGTDLPCPCSMIKIE